MKIGKMLATSLFIATSSIAAILILTTEKETFYCLKKIKLSFLIFAIFFHSLNWFIWAKRIQILTQAMGSDLTILKSTKIVLISLFFACITPSSVGGEPVRIQLLKDNGLTYGKASAIVITERISDAILIIPAFIFSLFAIGKFIKSEILSKFFHLSFILAVLIILILSFFILKPEKFEKFLYSFKKGRLNKFLDRIIKEFLAFREGLFDLARSREIAGKIIFLSAIRGVINLMVAPLILIGIGLKPSFKIVFPAQVIVLFASLFPITPGGSGIAEVGMFSLAKLFCPLFLVGVFVGIWRFITYILDIIVGGLLTFYEVKSLNF